MEKSTDLTSYFVPELPFKKFMIKFQRNIESLVVVKLSS